jgi:hypothetical protein
LSFTELQLEPVIAAAHQRGVPSIAGMRPPIFVRDLGAVEREQVEAARRTTDAFTLRRAQIVLASAR